MALKVGGTEVITNARQLSNIASVDATTVTALGTAGVGGGAYEVISDAAYTSDTSSVTFTVAPDYMYILEFNGLDITAGGSELHLTASSDAFSTTSTFQWAAVRRNIGGNKASQNHTAGTQAYARLTYGSVTTHDDDSVFGVMYFTQRTGYFPNHVGWMNEPVQNVDPPANYPQFIRSFSKITSTDSINRLRLLPNSGQFQASRIRLLRRS
tara:strand:- start:564 stop:1196 length:633 start_codon:yes stop_codon:yes gene_type:complete